jgi:hypothetical protein
VGGPAALPEFQDPASCDQVPVPSDTEPNPCEAQRAVAEAGKRLSHPPPAK